MHLPLLHIPFPLQNSGHALTAQKSPKLDGHFMIPSNPVTVRLAPGVVQLSLTVSPIVIVIIVPVSSQTDS
jgi:hypothetical protein